MTSPSQRANITVPFSEIHTTKAIKRTIKSENARECSKAALFSTQSVAQKLHFNSIPF